MPLKSLKCILIIQYKLKHATKVMSKKQKLYHTTQFNAGRKTGLEYSTNSQKPNN